MLQRITSVLKSVMYYYMYNDTYQFEWDEEKNQSNIEKHGLSFIEAQEAFFDPHHIIKIDAKHSVDEIRYFCVGLTSGEIATVRFAVRENTIRIIGVGYWRKGKRDYYARQER